MFISQVDKPACNVQRLACTGSLRARNIIQTYNCVADITPNLGEYLMLWQSADALDFAKRYKLYIAVQSILSEFCTVCPFSHRNRVHSKFLHQLLSARLSWHAVNPIPDCRSDRCTLPRVPLGCSTTGWSRPRKGCQSRRILQVRPGPNS